MEREMRWLIDERGVPWPTNTHRITGWGDPCDPVEFAVSDLGFVHLRLLNSGITVRFNPSRVRRRTMISAFFLMAGPRPKRIALSYGGGFVSHEICGTVREARYRIEEIVETHARTIPVLSRRRLSLDHQPKHIVEPITAVLRAWNDAAGQWTSERYAHLCTAVPLRDLVVVRN